MSQSLPLSQSRPARIVIDDGAGVVQLTQGDLLWAARAASGEVLPGSSDSDVADVLWTLAQRHAWWLGQGKTFDFAHTVRTFSQPISPNWSSLDAEGCQAHPEACTPEKLAQRQALAQASWAELRARDDQRRTQVVATVKAWAEGRVLNPLPRSTNFAVPSVAAAHVERNPGAEVVAKRGGHWFVSDPPATQWAADYVTLEGADGQRAGAARRLRNHAGTATKAFWDALTLQSFWR